MGARQSQGFTLIEMAVVLAVIAVLAAVLTPIITSYVERARISTAQSDVKNIEAAILQFNTDTKVWPIYTAGAEIPNGTTYDVVKTEGAAPSAGTGGTDWGMNLAAFGTTVGNLDIVLNTNFLNLPTTGNRAWKGAYLQLASDPWGSSYYVTAEHLRPDSMFAAYVISAGPNQTIDTDNTQVKGGSLVIGGDDIVARIR